MALVALTSATLGAAPATRPADPRLARRLEWFQDQRFGLMMHWGVYSNLGCIESWPLVWADRSWSNPAIKTMEEMLAFQRNYWGQNARFNPTKFRPEQWAKLAKAAGMKYVVFTTKHHDGFSLFDTKQTDYRVTHADCPFSRSAKPDVVAEVFKAFRAEQFGIGAYFSKSDWRSAYYWDPGRPALDRNPNYDTAREPDRWAKFVAFAHGQVEELMSNYGTVDILWLDGGQVRPPGQDLQMDKLVAMARKHQPDLIVVDRTAGTEHENYRTPEQEVPDRPLPYVWESCITMGKQWSYKPDDQYKSTRELIHLLVDVVAKGGNLLLNVGPTPDGEFPPPAVQRLEEIGRWMAVNAEAIHGTRAIAPHKQGRTAFTARGEWAYAIHLAADQETAPPATLEISGMKPPAGAEVRLLGHGAPLAWQPTPAGFRVEVPEAVRTSPPCAHAWVFKFPKG